MRRQGSGCFDYRDHAPAAHSAAHRTAASGRYGPCTTPTPCAAGSVWIATSGSAAGSSRAAANEWIGGQHALKGRKKKPFYLLPVVDAAIAIHIEIMRSGKKNSLAGEAPQLPGLLRALYRINSVRAGLYGAAASAYGDAFAQASRNATDTTAKRITGQLAAAYSQGGAQLSGYSSQAASLSSDE